jgi:hypothetical protein
MLSRKVYGHDKGERTERVPMDRTPGNIISRLQGVLSSGVTFKCNPKDGMVSIQPSDL